MSNKFSIPTPPDFSFRTAVGGHGWYDLPPFVYDEAAGKLGYTYHGRSGRVESVTILADSGSLSVELATAKGDVEEAAQVVRHILRFDEDFAEFYEAIRAEESFAWVGNLKAGRLLRSATVFEDLVKTICTTNCSWSLTRSMTNNLVDKLGSSSADGQKAFPTAAAMAWSTPDFFRDEIRAGYRSPYFVELAESVAAGTIDPEAWLQSELPTPELKKEIKKIKGIGDYAAENLLKLLGRYDGMALDSWLRGGFYKMHNRERPCPDKKIEKHYKKFGKWKGLAIWCDMTRDWFERAG